MVGKSVKAVLTPLEVLEARGGQFIYQERCRKYFAPLWKSSEARACLFLCEE